MNGITFIKSTAQQTKYDNKEEGIESRTWRLTEL